MLSSGGDLTQSAQSSALYLRRYGRSKELHECGVVLVRALRDAGVAAFQCDGFCAGDEFSQLFGVSRWDEDVVAVRNDEGLRFNSAGSRRGIEREYRLGLPDEGVVLLGVRVINRCLHGAFEAGRVIEQLRAVNERRLLAHDVV